MRAPLITDTMKGLGLGWETWIGWIDPRDYGAKGDGITDDSIALQYAFSAARYRGVLLQAGVKYIITSPLQMYDDCILQGQGAELEFNQPASKCLQLASFCTVRNLTVSQISTDTAGDGFDQCPILIGDEAAASGNGIHDIIIENVTVNQAADKNFIVVASDVYNIIIRNIHIPASTTGLIGIMVHWGAEGDDWETNGSNHPHNILIENIKCDKLKQAVNPDDSFVVLLSGCYNVTVRNIEVNNSWGAVRVQPGNPGSDQCQTYQEELILTGIIVENVTGKDVQTGLVATWASNDGTQSGGGDNKFEHDAGIIFRNCRLYGTLTSGNGATVQELSGVKFDHCDLQNYSQGLRVTDNVAGDGPGLVDRLVVRDCFINDVYYGGISIDAPNSADILIENTRISDVFKAGAGSGSQRNFITFDSDRTVLRDLKLGLAAGEGALRGVSWTGDDALLDNVHVLGIDDAAEVFENFGARATFINPKCDNAAATFGGGANKIIPALADEATPSVRGLSVALSGGTANDPITDLDDGVEGQEFTLIAAHSIVVNDGTGIYLDGRANLTMNSGDTLTVIQRSDGFWYQISASDNS